MNDIQQLLRPDLRGRSPYGAPQLDTEVRLNTNENSYPLPDEVAESVEKALSQVVRGLNRYPDRDAVALRADLANYLDAGLSVPRVWAANGSNEILQQLLQAFGGPGRTALGFTPAYSMHPIISAATGTVWIDGHRDVDFDLPASHATAHVVAHDPDVIFLCSPNNPTGTALPLEVVEAVLESSRGLVIVDEAYAEFARRGTASALRLLDSNPRLVVTRTMSKAFGFAGARLGYLAADEQVVDAIQLVRLPYHLSGLTQAAARAALAHAATLLSTVEIIKQQRDRLVIALRDMGLSVASSDANFVLFGGLTDSQATWSSLVNKGVLIRDVGLPGWLRVTAGSPTEVDRFLDAMSEVMEEKS